MKPVRMLHAAEQEMLDAIAYYELQVSGLGAIFLDKVESAIADIAENPERWPILGLNIRRRLLHRFPYAILYRVDTDALIVLAVSHLHRRPCYWIDRI